MSDFNVTSVLIESQLPYHKCHSGFTGRRCTAIALYQSGNSSLGSRVDNLETFGGALPAHPECDPDTVAPDEAVRQAAVHPFRQRFGVHRYCRYEMAA